MKVFYYANQVYQFSYALPLYKRIGGTLIVRNYRKLFRFKRYLINGNAFPEVNTFLNTPPIVKFDIKNLYNLEGIILSQSNTRINCDHDKCKSIFIGHGTGDKKYGGNPAALESYDYVFVAGPKHLAKLQDVGVSIPEERLIRIGNLKFDQYINGEIDREQHLDELGISDRTRKNILYAPTWKWGNGTLHKYVYTFCRELTKEFNLIVRPHYFEARYIPMIKAWVRINRIKHVYFSNPANIFKHDTMTDFTVSDLLISDTSSVFYEYLVTGNPIIVAESDYDDLHTMPESMDIRSVADVYDGLPGSNILTLVMKQFDHGHKREQHHALLDNCFYHNDGHCTDRAIEFISTLQE